MSRDVVKMRTGYDESASPSLYLFLVPLLGFLGIFVFDGPATRILRAGENPASGCSAEVN